MSPGLPVDKYVLSQSDLKQQRRDDDSVHSYSPPDVIKAMLTSKPKGEGGGAHFQAALRNPKSKKKETLEDLLCFGNSEVRNKR
jgi:hypothetical protein